MISSRELAAELMKEYLQKSDLLQAAYKVREKGLEYALILKTDEAETRGVFSDYLDQVSESLPSMRNIVIHYILPELEEHIIHCEKIV